MNTYLADVISQIEMKPVASIGDFSKEKFVQTVSDYNQKITRMYEIRQSKFENAFQQSVKQLKEAIPDKPIP